MKPTIDNQLEMYRRCRAKMEDGTCDMVCENCQEDLMVVTFGLFHRLEAIIEGPVEANRDETRFVTGCGYGYKFTPCEDCVRQHDPQRCQSWRAGTGFVPNRRLR